MQLTRWAVARPWRALAAQLVLTLAAAPGLLHLELRTDGNALVPPDDPVVLFDAEVREHFQLTDPIVVFLTTTHPDGIYNLATLTSVQRLDDALRALEGVEDVMSLASERRDRVYLGTLKFRPFLDPLPDTPERMAWLRSDVDAASILTGTLVSADRRSTALLVGIRPGPNRGALSERIRSEVEPFANAGDTILVAGAPVAESLLGTHLIEDLTVLLPLSLVTVAAVIWVACRRLWGALLGFLEVGACLVFTFGLMGWLGTPVYLTTAVLPVVLTAIGLADEIHIFWCYQGVAAQAPEASRQDLALRTLRAMTRPVVVTSLTTSIGFLSFTTSSIVSVKSFGLFAAAGILFCMLFSLVAVPAFLVLLGPEKLRRPRSSGAAATPWTVRLAAPLVRRRRTTLAVLFAVSVLAAWGLRRIEVQDSWIDGFAPDSPFYLATERVNEKLHGTHLLLAHLEADGEEPFFNPALLNAVGDFEAFARSVPGVGGVLGPHSQLTAVAYLWLARNEEKRAIPAEPVLLRRLLKRFDQGRGARRRREILDDALERAVVTVFLKNANYRETAALLAALREDAERRLAPFGVELAFAGDVAVSQAMIREIVRTQVFSLAFAVGGAFVCLCLLYRSLRMGLLAVAPVAVAVLWVFGVMGWLGVPLGVATSMFCAITLGIGVDYAIHFLERFRAADGPEPVLVALREAGPAIAADTLAVGLGFGLLTVSQVPANARLGLLVALALAAGCLLTLGGLGAFLAGSPRRVMRYRGLADDSPKRP